MIARLLIALTAAASIVQGTASARAEGDWEITPQSREALDRGLQWLARNQGPKGNWDSNDMGLVSLGALAFLADGHTPGRGPVWRRRGQSAWLGLRAERMPSPRDC